MLFQNVNLYILDFRKTLENKQENIDMVQVLMYAWILFKYFASMSRSNILIQYFYVFVSTLLVALRFNLCGYIFSNSIQV